MIKIITTNELFHRNRKRIKEFGEVFTPEVCVEALLSDLHTNIWSDEEIVFFEPCCGHGNIVISIYKKRLQAIYKKAKRKGIQDSAYYAVANAINTLWAIDIDITNINHCRTRVLDVSFDFLRKTLGINEISHILHNDQKFIAHLLCAINWHIHVNETLSALSKKQIALANAKKTKVSANWFFKNNHNFLNFEMNWVTYFKSFLAKGTIPSDYKIAIKYVENIQKLEASNEFEKFKFESLLFSEKYMSKMKMSNLVDTLQGYR